MEIQDFLSVPQAMRGRLFRDLPIVAFCILVLKRRMMSQE
jgi:hypothetical protein